jgi:hypothetical protein
MACGHDALRPLEIAKHDIVFEDMPPNFEHFVLISEGN